LHIVIEGDLGCASPLIELARAAGLTVLQSQGPGAIRIDGVHLALTDGRTATTRAAQDGEAVILFDLALDYITCTRIALAAADQSTDEQLATVAGFFQLLGKTVSVIDDAPGMVVMRTVSMLANEAADTVHQKVASVRDVELAMQKGVNYPVGPLAWADLIGVRATCKVLDNMAAYYGEDRYRVSPLLRRTAIAGAKFATPV
jgi:3-hydroxybutyryl-CoA dehydrogenase